MRNWSMTPSNHLLEAFPGIRVTKRNTTDLYDQNAMGIWWGFSFCFSVSTTFFSSLLTFTRFAYVSPLMHAKRGETKESRTPVFFCLGLCTLVSSMSYEDENINGGMTF